MASDNNSNENTSADKNKDQLAAGTVTETTETAGSGGKFADLEALFETSATEDKDKGTEDTSDVGGKGTEESQGGASDDKSGVDKTAATDSQGRDKEGAGSDTDTTTLAINNMRAEMSEMRTMLLAAARKNNLLSKELELTKQKLTESGTLPEMSKDDAKDLAAKREARTDEVTGYVESMRLSNKYGDVDKVVTQSRVDDLVNTLARGFAKKEGLELSEAIDQVQQWVWNGHKNPYRWLYEELKSKHPDFQEKKDKSSGEDKKKDVAPSLSNMQGSGSGGTENLGKWTTKRIDEMPEDELDTIPKDVYAKYMAGELE